MDLSKRKVWQQACGDTRRDYGLLCLRLGVILIGYDAEQVPTPEVTILGDEYASQDAPGSPRAINELLISDKKKDDLRRFCHEMAPNDVVVLRRGTAHVWGVGVVVGPYLFDDRFGDIDGWDIRLIRRVRWIWSGEQHQQTFGTYAMTFGRTTSSLDVGGEVWRWVESLPEIPLMAGSEYDPRKLGPESSIGLGQISDYLFDRGVASGAIGSLTSEMGELVRIAKWYGRTGHYPSEAETLAYLVVPLLRALGWTPQRMAVEWYKIDVALFSSLPRSDDTLRGVVEVKRMNDSCLSADVQARRYATGKKLCHRLVLTDGLRYAIHTRQGDGEFKLAAYLNLARMRDAYRAYECGGAQEALLLMSPDMESAG